MDSLRATRTFEGMKDDAKCDFLVNHGWLAQVPVEFATALLNSCRWRNFGKDQCLYVAGDAAGGIFGFISGAVAATSGQSTADAPAAHLLQPGCWVGLGPLLTGEPRRITLMAVSPVQTAYVPLPELRRLLDANPGWWKYIAQELLIEIDMVMSISTDLLLRDSRQRGVATLLRVSGYRMVDPPPNVIANVPVSQLALAEMANMSRSAVSIVLGDLATAGKIGLHYRSIDLLDVPGLRRIIDGTEPLW